MKKIEMSKEILNVICAVLSHRTYICDDAWVRGYWDKSFDYYKLNMQYYFDLPLPEEMKRNIDDYERVLSYTFRSEELDKLCNTEYGSLAQFTWKTT